MKHLNISLLLFLFFFSLKINAQNFCTSPYPFTSDSTYTYFSTISTSNPDNTNNYGCLLTTPNPTWFYLKICTAGNLDLTISSQNSSSSGTDVDFILWGPLVQPTDCGLDSTQIVDCSYSTGATETANIPFANVGEYYKLLITAYSDSPSIVTLGQTGGTGFSCATWLPPLPCSTPIPQQQICMATTDFGTNHNTIIWEKDTSYIGTVFIQKETTTMGIYSDIGSQLNSVISTFEDTISDPTQQAYKYRIATADTCGNFFYGNAHKTIHLLTSLNPGSGNPQLSWNDYIGFYYSKYYIYRGNSTATLALYDSISLSFLTYTDVNPQFGMVYYAISVNPPNPCSPSKNLTACFSNLSQVNYNSISNFDNDLNSFSIWPNPTNDFLNFELKNNNVKEFNLELLDVTGRLLFLKSFNGIYKEKIDVGEFSNGVYLLKISNTKDSAFKRLIINR